LEYVRLLPEAELHVKFLENQWANLVCGRSRTRIAGMSRESFPELPEFPEILAEIPVAILSTLIGKTIFAISSEESRFTLNGALLILKSEGMSMVSTDGHRLAYVDTKSQIPGIKGAYRALLPKKAMSEILKLAQEAPADAVVQFAGDENHLFFRFGDRLVISRKLTGNFPDFERVLPREHGQSVQLGREETRAAIERVSQFSDERSHAVRIQVCPGEVKIHSSLSETGESEESIPTEYGGPTTEIGFNAQYMLDFLRASSEENIQLHFKDASSAGEFRPEGSEENYEYRYVVMPMRI
ncbi:MAG: DNA polymerase III subunit beta, partial [Bryobacteraceae bacterium]